MSVYRNSSFTSLSDSTLLRVNQIVRPSKKSISDEGRFDNYILPISRSTWWRMVKSGDAPQPIKISAGVVVWRVGDLRSKMNLWQDLVSTSG
jgi:hypothetical protein